MTRLIIEPATITELQVQLLNHHIFQLHMRGSRLQQSITVHIFPSNGRNDNCMDSLSYHEDERKYNFNRLAIGSRLCSTGLLF